MHDVHQAGLFAPLPTSKQQSTAQTGATDEHDGERSNAYYDEQHGRCDYDEATGVDDAKRRQIERIEPKEENIERPLAEHQGQRLNQPEGQSQLLGQLAPDFAQVGRHGDHSHVHAIPDHDYAHEHEQVLKLQTQHSQRKYSLTSHFKQTFTLF